MGRHSGVGVPQPPPAQGLAGGVTPGSPAPRRLRGSPESPRWPQGPHSTFCTVWGGEPSLLSPCSGRAQGRAAALIPKAAPALPLSAINLPWFCSCSASECARAPRLSQPRSPFGLGSPGPDPSRATHPLRVACFPCRPAPVPRGPAGRPRAHSVLHVITRVRPSCAPAALPSPGPGVRWARLRVPLRGGARTWRARPSAPPRPAPRLRSPEGAAGAPSSRLRPLRPLSALPREASLVSGGPEPGLPRDSTRSSRPAPG